MSRPRHTWRFAAACGIALLAGISLRALQSRGPRADPAPTAKTEAPGETLRKAAATAGPGSPSNAKLLMQRAVASCDDDSLWEFAQTISQESDLQSAVVREIIDRMGWGAWDKALAMAEGPGQSRLMSSLLSALSDRDPWKAYAEWMQHRPEILEGDWGHSIAYPVIKAACAISGERLIELLKEIPADYWIGVRAEFAADFDFRAVMDYVNARESACCMPDELLLEWARRSPAEAATWWKEHPEYLAGREEWPRIYTAIASADLDPAERGALLIAIETSQATEGDRAWEKIGAASQGKIDPTLLESARWDSSAEEYLRTALFKTRELETLDDSWRQVPPEERARARAAVEEKWASEQPGAIHDRARERWGRMLDEAWGGQE